MSRKVLLSTTGEVKFYVCQSPNIMFSEDKEEALRFNKQEALDALSVLLDMQRSSSSPESYVLEPE